MRCVCVNDEEAEEAETTLVCSSLSFGRSEGAVSARAGEGGGCSAHRAGCEGGYAAGSGRDEIPRASRPSRSSATAAPAGKCAVLRCTRRLF